MTEWSELCATHPYGCRCLVSVLFFKGLLLSARVSARHVAHVWEDGIFPPFEVFNVYPIRSHQHFSCLGFLEVHFRSTISLGRLKGHAVPPRIGDYISLLVRHFEEATYGKPVMWVFASVTSNESFAQTEEGARLYSQHSSLGIVQSCIRRMTLIRVCPKSIAPD